MDDAPNDNNVRQLARAEELRALAAQARTPAARVLYLQLAAAFRQLALGSASGGRSDARHGGRDDRENASGDAPSGR